MNDLSKNKARKLLQEYQQSIEEALYELAMTKATYEEKLVEIEGLSVQYEKKLNDCDRVLEDIGYEH
jgi:hypothetical protein